MYKNIKTTVCSMISRVSKYVKNFAVSLCAIKGKEGEIYMGKF